MTCIKCLNNKCKIKKENIYGMECKTCKNKQFYTKRLKHIPVSYVCSICRSEISIKKSKKEDKPFEQKEEKE